MAKAKVRDLKVSLARCISGIRGVLAMECEDPKVPDKMVELDEYLEGFEGIIYGDLCHETRVRCLKRQVLFDPRFDLKD
jgi:hypothetical protein